MAMSATTRRTLMLICGVVLVVCVVGASLAFLSGTRESGSATEPHASGSASAAAPGGEAPQGQVAQRQSGEVAKAMASVARKDPNDPRARGRLDAPVLMIELSDYSCPMCAAYYHRVMPRLQSLIDDGTLRIEFHDMAVFDQRYHSAIGALGGIAAAKQGRFWQYLNAAEELAASDHPTWTPQLATQVAEKAGVPDLEAFAAGLNDSTALAQITADKEKFQSWGVSGTPAFFINDRFILGAQDPQVFLDTIAAAKADAQR